MLVNMSVFDRCYSESILSCAILSLHLKSLNTILLILLGYGFVIIGLLISQ